MVKALRHGKKICKTKQRYYEKDARLRVLNEGIIKKTPTRVSFFCPDALEGKNAAAREKLRKPLKFS